MDNLQIPRVFTELMTLDPSISMQEVNLQHGERKIDIKIKTIDENGNDKYVKLGTPEGDKVFNEAVNKTFYNAKSDTKTNSKIIR